MKEQILDAIKLIVEERAVASIKDTTGSVNHVVATDEC
jgi:hypothetical protein